MLSMESSLIVKSGSFARKMKRLYIRAMQLAMHGYLKKATAMHPVIFPKAPPISRIFLWVVVHFIVVVCCILDLTNFFWGNFVWAFKFTVLLKLFLPSFATLTLKFSLSLLVLKNFYNFYSVPTLNIPFLRIA